jgi:hypothetical protein
VSCGSHADTSTMTAAKNKKQIYLLTHSLALWASFRTDASSSLLFTFYLHIFIFSYCKSLFASFSHLNLVLPIFLLLQAYLFIFSWGWGERQMKVCIKMIGASD